MILAFSGDAFLVSRAARTALKARGFAPHEITELNQGMSAPDVKQLASQSGLFGQVALLLDFDTAFQGQAGVKPRNEVLKALQQVPDTAVIVVLDCNASPSRIKTYTQLGEHSAYPTPRFGALGHWTKLELDSQNVHYETDVPQVLADLFGEDLPGIAAEVQKLAVLDETLSAERVRQIVNRPAARDAFDLLNAITVRNTRMALEICQSLTAQGEAPPRILGALTWQYNIVAHIVGLKASRGHIDAALVAQQLKIKPFVAKKSLGIANKFDEARLYFTLKTLLETDIRIKSGKGETWALEALVVALCMQA